MSPFNRRTAIRISAVSLLLAAIASSIAWFVARENAEESTVSLAVEESRRLLDHFDATTLSGLNAQARAQAAASVIAGGLFDIAEIYDARGNKMAEAMTEDGQVVEDRLPKHQRPQYTRASYESLDIGGRWLLRVFVPLQSPPGQGAITGYFEGVRVVSDWQRQQIRDDSLAAAFIACLASILCGAAIYPVVVHLSRENEKKAREVLESHISIMEAMGRAIAKRDSDTGAHNYRVAWIAAAIAEELELDRVAMQSLIVGSYLHDVGKIGIPDAILLKPGRLDEDEFRIMRLHVQQGEDIVSGIGWLDGANAVVSGHHEKWDGSGYPRRIAGEAIPLAARIFAVADVFDALCSRRPYKEPMTFEAAMEIMEKDTGSHFDPVVMSVFKPIARIVYDRLALCNEEQARALLKAQIRLHFGV